MTVHLIMGTEHYIFGGATLEETQNACVCLFNTKHRYPGAANQMDNQSFCQMFGNYLEQLYKYYPNTEIHLIPDKEIEASVLEIFDILHTECMKVRADPSATDTTIMIILDEEGKRIC